MPKYYMVTFDLLNSAGRTNDYKAAEDAIRFLVGPGNYWKFVKQCAIVRTNRDARDIRNTLGQRLGSNCNILIVRLRRGYAFKLKDAVKRNAARRVLQNIP